MPMPQAQSPPYRSRGAQRHAPRARHASGRGNCTMPIAARRSVEISSRPARTRSGSKDACSGSSAAERNCSGSNNGPTGPMLMRELRGGGGRQLPRGPRQRVLNPRLRAVGRCYGGRPRRGGRKEQIETDQSCDQAHRSGRVNAPIHVEGNVNERNRVRRGNSELTRGWVWVGGPIIARELDRAVTARGRQAGRKASKGGCITYEIGEDVIGDGDHVRVLPRYADAKTEFEFATRLAAEQFFEADKAKHRPGRRRKVA